jgi:hypothetical protein
MEGARGIESGTAGARRTVMGECDYCCEPCETLIGNTLPDGYVGRDVLVCLDCDAIINDSKDSPGIPLGQAAGGEPVAARDAEGEEPGPGDGVTSPARVSDDEREREPGEGHSFVVCEHCGSHIDITDDLRRLVFDDGETRPASVSFACDWDECGEDFDALVYPAVPPSTWLPPGASEPDGEYIVTDAQVERMLHEAAPIHDERADACVGRVRARLFGKDGGT